MNLSKRDVVGFYLNCANCYEFEVLGNARHLFDKSSERVLEH